VVVLVHMKKKYSLTNEKSKGPGLGRKEKVSGSSLRQGGQSRALCIRSEDSKYKGGREKAPRGKRGGTRTYHERGNKDQPTRSLSGHSRFSTLQRKGHLSGEGVEGEDISQVGKLKCTLMSQPDLKIL